ncbi:FeoC-like transcriptional regulator [Pyrococcus horikoshii]|uniref:HTH domain-containing protein n=1 Tax=Pyrococcus horikoshii TaxID=53953 RepID=A0A832WIH7_PYRHR|nr:HTH domain-containing protein [Pyrococcus horikoshii]HII60217.1 HTH domain-containing protein [Pyrococcus horikoshii]
MGIIEKALEIIEKGPISIEELAEKLNVSKEEAEGIIEILKSLGYVEEHTSTTTSCETCPLRNICGGKCVRSGVKVFVPTFRVR